MMMTTVIRENLDERIERIKKRNEEIEKKYREAEEDRLMALKDNAMVEIKPPKDEDWPKAHKYDKLDFTYDVKPEKLEELNKQKKEELKINKRDYKKFAEGEGPPPDPAYNFLADAERDGVVTPGKNEINKKDSRQNNNMSGNKSKEHQQQQQQNKRGGPNNNSFRGRNNKNHNGGKYQKQNSQPEYEQWRNEREKIDEARINRQKVGDGKWKREWDNDKINAESDTLFRSEKITSNDANSKKIQNYNAGKLNRQNLTNNFMNGTDCLVEKRGNITVSISQTGEVKSVKLTSAPAIGTGRVGPRQIIKPQFSIQTVEREGTVQQMPPSPRAQNENLTKNINNNSAIINQTNLTQKVPNKTADVIANDNSKAALITSPNMNSTKSSKEKKHSPKQLLPGGNQKIDSQLIKSIASPQVSGNKLVKNVSTNVEENNALKQNLLQSSNLQILKAINEKQLVSTPVTGSNPNTTAVLPTSIFNDPIKPLNTPEIPIPIVDLSHKPEFQKRSIQDRLLRVRQANNNVNNVNVNNGATTVNNTASIVVNNISSNSNLNKNESTTNEKDSNLIQCIKQNDNKNDNQNYPVVSNGEIEKKSVTNQEDKIKNSNHNVVVENNKIIPSSMLAF